MPLAIRFVALALLELDCGPMSRQPVGKSLARMRPARIACRLTGGDDEVGFEEPSLPHPTRVTVTSATTAMAARRPEDPSRCIVTLSESVTSSTTRDASDLTIVGSRGLDPLVS